MSDRLLQRFEDQARLALLEPGSGKTIAAATLIRELLARSLWLHVTGDLKRVSPSTIKQLRARGSELLLAGDGASREKNQIEDVEDQQLVQGAIDEVVRAGLDAISGRAPRIVSRIRMHPPTLTLTRMYRGEADGFTAGRYAAHIADCERCQRQLDALRFVEDTESSSERLSVAAAASASVRDPGEGRTVATLKSPALEAVLFEDGRLAVYADSNESLRVVAEGVTTEQTLGGYWLGRVDEGVKRLAAVVHLGSAEHRWSISFG